MTVIFIIILLFAVFLFIGAVLNAGEKQKSPLHESHNDFMKRLKELEPKQVLVSKEKNHYRRRTKEEIREDLIINALEDGYRSALILDDYALIAIIEITGIHVEGRYSKISQLKKDSVIELVKEPENTFDKKAVKIVKNDKLLGYVPRTELALVRRVMQYEYTAYLYDFYNDEGYKKAFFALYLKK